ncbi:SDR family NAD(P)-dependent oxidoreductase [Alteribacter natronophilus]|uniref:SDR family NAD(P)-dependent oxidoreductase n=1 Tax=Alteribacter natronophilus TaxID=2583810 RepID=UPI00110F332A|nr:SDR family NAD(P)-dependent oxidoreductase [Alteribacter natronophilus]TMW70094.1 SDR family oxidoreductase [Alteribacter natronophilus]
MSFNGKVVVITGAAGGIGKEAVKSFSNDGAKVTLVDLDQEALDQAAAELDLNDGQYITVAADVGNEAQVKNFIEKTVEAFGTVDVLFNNAGIEGKVLPIPDYPSELFDKVLDVNVKGVFYGLKYAMPIMKENKGGSIINTASVAGLGGTAGVSAYITSKHALLGLTKTAALEGAPDGIRVNAVCPSPVNNRMMRSLEAGFSPENAEAAQKSFAAAIPLGRYAENHEIADLVYFLASEKASFITGGIYTIDGGMKAT